MIKNLIDKIISGDVDASKRKFVKSAAGLAALTCVGLSGIPLDLKAKSIQDKIDTGFIYGETFYIDQPIVIDIPGVSIVGCTFICVAPMPYMVRISTDSLRICDCTSISGGFATETVLYDNIETSDCSVSLCSAIDATQSSDIKTLRLREGTYNIGGQITFHRNIPSMLDDQKLMFKTSYPRI